MQKVVFTVEDDSHRSRLDYFLQKKFSDNSGNIESNDNNIADYSRSYCQKLIVDDQVAINGKITAKSSAKINSGDVITITIPPPKPLELQSWDYPLDIIYEDDDLLVINKPVNMTVHPAAGEYEHTLVNALLAHCQGNLSGIGGVERPGIVHRLDKDTSGLMLVAKNDITHRKLSEMIANREVKRRYLAICWLMPDNAHLYYPEYEGMVDANIGRDPLSRVKMKVFYDKRRADDSYSNSKTAITYFRVDKVNHKFQLAKIFCQLQTGRTHQIRVHMKHIGLPLVGDNTYSYSPGRNLCRDIIKEYGVEQLDMLIKFPHQALHSCEIEFKHPILKEKLNFFCDAPPQIQKLLDLF